MAKSVRSKVKKRWRSLKRKVTEEQKTKGELQILENRLKSTINGIEYREPEKKNAFLHPEDPEAVFPQFVPQKNIDFRANNIPYSGLEYAGSARPKKHAQATLSEYALSVIEDFKNKQQLKEQIKNKEEIDMDMDANTNINKENINVNFNQTEEDMEDLQKAAEKFKQQIEMENNITKPTKLINKKAQNQVKKKKSKKLVKF
ncbi:hypothetical protein PPERSA_10383 [Pseudocohnilembus persalinus]|uniref:Uncharacterized protein n=1 Tax=Pseudocohnilembus persalinus TaxID=266149 RepID=A0A0V0R230_PSEPJ|nr:hypothetical protein PPERSA_10383 [Pseudocohnilembus persalinus]|eukprot:KRX08579.1 hypothetical protein PPERSA_10383 [Pseudocohnilembus persalinus]